MKNHIHVFKISSWGKKLKILNQSCKKTRNQTKNSFP